MIERTFQHLPGIGMRTERVLWNRGIRDWNAFLNAPTIDGIRPKRKLILDHLLREDLIALREETWSRFHRWPLSLHHRALPHLERVIYLDIETYGVGDHRVAIIAVSDADSVELIDGTRIDRETLEHVLRADAIVTYNGNRFDIPYLARVFRFEASCFTIDLEPLARANGLTGGLKRIERDLGIDRAYDLRGGDPLSLWRSYRATGDTHFLEILSSYIEQDVLSLPIIARHVLRAESSLTRATS